MASSRDPRFGSRGIAGPEIVSVHQTSMEFLIVKRRSLAAVARTPATPSCPGQPVPAGELETRQRLGSDTRDLQGLVSCSRLLLSHADSGKGSDTGLQNSLEFAHDRAQPCLQARSVQFAAAERPPVGELAFHDFQTHPADCFSGPSSIDQPLKIALQVHHPNAIDKLRTTMVIPFRSTTRPYAPRSPR